MRGLIAAVLVGAALVVPARSAVAHADAIRPNDPGYVRQWGLTKTRVNEAWSAGKGNGRVVIAVVDTGVSPVSDLAGRVLPGYDFVNGDTNAADDNGHGTMAAGVIAASGYDGKGVAGVCWACRILPVKVLNANGEGGYDKIVAGIRYAADHGATIISLSLGAAEDDAALRAAVAYAQGKGSLVIAAAGNSGKSAVHFPAAFPSVLAVGGVDQADKRYAWSNYGSWVDVAAPGCNVAQQPSGVIGDYCGTSSATPFVAGVAGLLASTDPAPTAAQIRAALIASKVRPSGRIDALAAMNALPFAGDVTRPAVAFVGVPAVARGRVTITAAAADQHGVAKVQLYAAGKLVSTDTTSPYALTWQTPGKSSTVRLELRAYDRAGNVTAVRRDVRTQ
ncbi:S8 family serine peptidase [Actinoplanes sp. TBRC 11911]|uniref:S8 family serine peptidase n=1 Tax=Actinoplanes sp. TBRC 11911 TaxID=2729386 RepID=UPI00145F548B|nr:S8 family serine peptidase [Actinoplanes sp. TBRC 11911]NMO57032.1 S8 family serine peptidase [Actinoplanes sp. TBRC 11911]